MQLRRSRSRADRTAPGRVLIIVQNLSVPLDRRVWLECLALRAAGHQVSVICPRGKNDTSYEELEGVRIYRYKAPPPTKGFVSFAYEFAYCWIRTALLGLRVLFRGGVDVVQACNPPDTYFALAALLKPFGKQFVFDQHDLCPELYESRFDAPSRAVLETLRLLERATYALADHVIATNDSYREIAMARGKKRPETVTVVRNGPDPERMFRREPVPELRNGRDHLCCYLGVMGPQDGVDLVLQAARVLIHDRGRTDCQFALIGSGDCFDELQQLAHDLDIDDWVTFTGRIPDELLFDYLSTADVGLSPDPKNPLNDVSTMNKTMEYMAFELPVVAYDLKETKVSAREAAVYVEPGDVAGYAAAISSLLDDPTERARLGTIGRQRVVETLCWSKQVAGFVAVYDALLSGDPQSLRSGGHEAEPLMRTNGSRSAAR
jgi:glycosyltransferase involved in cell wall biosynthesis